MGYAEKKKAARGLGTVHHDLPRGQVGCRFLNVAAKKAAMGVDQPSIVQKGARTAPENSFLARFSYGRACVLAFWLAAFLFGRFLVEHTRPDHQGFDQGLRWLVNQLTKKEPCYV